MADPTEDVPGSEEELTWSEECYTISELVDLYDLPCLLRVAEGIYSTEDTESFSNGDYLKLHRCERLEKVVAYPIESGHTKKSALKNYKKISSPILIPLDYRKKARVLTIGGDTRYPTIQSLLADMPRYVEVGARPIYGRHLHTREIVMVPARSPLELVRTTKNLATKSVSLLCRYDRHELELEPDCRGNFVAVRDPTSYTFREVINRFCLPQLIELKKDFLQDEKLVTNEVQVALANMDQFQGTFVLDRVDSEYKAFGTHRLDLENADTRQPAVDVSGIPQAVKGSNSSRQAVEEPSDSQEAMDTYQTHQAIVIIPYTSDALFQVATNRETSIYQSFISMNFRANLDTVSLGGLYMEIQGSKLSQTVESDYCYPDLATLDIPDFYEASGLSPPLLSPRRPLALTPRPPPRPARPPPKGHAEHTLTSATSTDRVNVIPISAPSIPPRSNRSKRRTDYLRPLPRSPETSNIGKVSPTSKSSPSSKVFIFRKPDIRVAPKPMKKQPKPSQAVRPLRPEATTNSGGKPLTAVGRQGRKPTYVELAGDNAQPQKSYSSDSTNSGSTSKNSRFANEGVASKQVSGRQETPLVGATGSSNPSGRDWNDRLKTLSVEEVREALGRLGLRKKVEPFVQMEIDGGYLQVLYSEQGNVLQTEPFSLNSVEMLKLKMFVETGKLPIKTNPEYS